MFLLILLFLPGNNCNDKTKQGNQISKLIYEVSTRGYYRHIEISEKQITVSSSRDRLSPLSGEISIETWQRLVLMLEGMEIGELSSLNTATEESALDRSLIGELTVYIGENTYTSPMFDHSNPPDELRGLISQMMALAETVE